MRSRGVTGVLAAGCIALAAVGYLASQSQDRTAPKITVKKEDITYQAGNDYSDLLKGVSAKDSKDGELTDQVFVDKVVPTGDGSATVYYAVTDEANNVGTATEQAQIQARMTRLRKKNSKSKRNSRNRTNRKNKRSRQKQRLMQRQQKSRRPRRQQLRALWHRTVRNLPWL